jgi:hypothetical protein
MLLTQSLLRIYFLLTLIRAPKGPRWGMVYASYAFLPRDLKDQKKLSRSIIISH